MHGACVGGRRGYACVRAGAGRDGPIQPYYIPAAYLLHTYCILLTAHGLRLTPHDEHWQAQEEMAAAGFDFAGFGGSKRNG